jgi:AcrR family transcriptional regulator
MTPAGLRDGAPPGGAAVKDETSFRERLIQAMADSVRDRGFRETTIADVVRLARTSRRTFYAEFASREECYAAMLERMNEALRERIAAAVDLAAPWQAQVRQAVLAYVDKSASEPELTVSWIRELPALGLLGRQVQRHAMDSLADLLVEQASSAAFLQAGTVPMTRPLAMILLGGIRELTAAIVEDEGDIHDLTEVAVAAAIALLRPPPAAG